MKLSTKQRLLELNARLAEKLTSKGVEASANETTTALINKVDEIESGGNYDEGYKDGHEAGFEAGKAEGGGDSWYDTFWDSYQEKGNREKYQLVFAGYGWNDSTFKPKYDIVPKQADSVFRYSNITDLVEALNKAQVVLDLSKSTWNAELFSNSSITHVGVLDLSSESNTYNILLGAHKLHTVDLFRTANRTDHTLNASYCESLVNIKIEGILGRNVLFTSSPLSVDSAKSIINAIINYAGTENEFKYTITFSETTWGYLDAEGNASPNGNSWREYINDLGWNAS